MYHVRQFVFYYGTIIFILLFLSNANTYEKTDSSLSPESEVLHCSKLLFGQYTCDEPVIHPETQQAKDCDRETRTVAVACHPAPNITCQGRVYNDSLGFYKHVPCKWTNGHSFETALLLSIFLGMFGIDRLYLGYPAIGLLKFSTLGFMFLGQLVDILLIATQVSWIYILYKIFVY